MSLVRGACEARCVCLGVLAEVLAAVISAEVLGGLGPLIRAGLP